MNCPPAIVRGMIAGMTAIAPEISSSALLLEAPKTKPPRITSIDAARGFVMFTMIYVNDFPEDVGSWWMHHAPGSADWMTFVDIVFPGFLFLVGMSIPIALGSRLNKGEPLWKTIGHV